MILPKWNDPTLRAGTMIRSALWLLSEVGVGNTFTKEQHRLAFPGVSQADRRLRDLRDWEWIIHTNTEDITLKSEEQRLVSAGLAVWEKGVCKLNKTVQLKAKARMAALAENDYQCITCGIAGGENYLDIPQSRAVLGVSRKAVLLPGGNKQTMFVPECKRCRAGKQENCLDIPSLLNRIKTLSLADRTILNQWLEHGRRSTIDKIWSEFRQLPADAKSQVLENLSE